MREEICLKGKSMLFQAFKDKRKDVSKEHLEKQRKKTGRAGRLGLILAAVLLWGGGGVDRMEGGAVSLENGRETGKIQETFTGLGMTAYGEETLAETEQPYTFPGADKRELTEEDLEGMKEEELLLGLQEIYARHGMIFADESLNEYFQEKDWYFGFVHEAEFPEELLNEFETVNAEFLREKISGGRETKGELGEGTTAKQTEEQKKESQRGTEEKNTEDEEQEQEKDLTAEETEAETKKETETITETTSEKETEKERETERAEDSGIEKGTGGKAEQKTEAETEAATETEEFIIKIPEMETAGEESKLEDIQNVDIMGIYGGEDETLQKSGGENRNRGQNIRDSEYIFPDAASRYLSRSEVESLSLQAICYAKNEIYARHGRKFLARELQEYFGGKSWYQGFVEPEAFSDKVFNDFERQNLLLLVECEQAIRPDGYQLDQPGYDISLIGTADKDTAAKDQAAKTGAGERGLDSRDYIFPDSDVRYLTEKEAAELSPDLVHLAWNEIYARRGYIFEPGEIRDYFRSKSWYAEKISPQDFTADMLNKFEQYNIRLLYAREQKQEKIFKVD